MNKPHDRYRKIEFMTPKRLLWRDVSLKTAEGEEPDQYRQVEGLEEPQKIQRGEKDVSAQGLRQELADLAKITSMVQYARAYPDDLPSPATEDELINKKADRSMKLTQKLFRLGNEQTLAELKVLGDRTEVDFSNLAKEVKDSANLSDLSADMRVILKELAKESGLTTTKVDDYVKATQVKERHELALKIKKEKLEDEKARIERMKVSKDEINANQKAWDTGLKFYLQRIGLGVGLVSGAVALGNPPVALGIAALAAGGSLLTYVGGKAKFGIDRLVANIKNASTKTQEFFKGDVRKAEKEAIKEQSVFDEAKETFDIQANKLDRGVENFTKAKVLVEASLNEKTAQLAIKQRDLLTEKAAGKNTNATKAEIKTLIEEQQKLQKVLDRLEMTISAYGKLKEDAKKNVSVKDLQKFWYDSNNEGLGQAVESFAKKTDTQTLEAQETVAEVSYEKARDQLKQLRFSQLKALKSHFSAGALNRAPQEVNVKAVKSDAPDLYKVLTSVAKMAGDADYKRTVFKDLRDFYRDLVKDVKVSGAGLKRKTANFFKAPAAGGHPQAKSLLKKDVIMQVAEEVIHEIDGGEDIDLDELFPKDFRNINELKKLVLSDLTIPQMFLFQRIFDALSGTDPEIVLGENERVETQTGMKERLKGTTKAAFENLPNELREAIRSDLPQITSIHIEGFPDAERDKLPSAVLSRDFDHYLEACTPEQLQILQDFLLKIRERGALHGRKRVVDFEDVKRFQIVDLMGDIELLPTRRGLDGAMRSVLNHPRKLRVALDLLQRYGGHIGGRDFSASFATIERTTYDDEMSFVRDIDSQDDLALIVTILENLDGNLIMTPFNMANEPAARIHEGKDNGHFYSIESAAKDIQGDMKVLLSEIGTDDITAIDKFEYMGKDLMKDALVGITTPGGLVKIDGQDLTHESNWRKLPYVMLTLDHIVHNLDGRGVAGSPNALKLDPGASAAGKIEIEDNGTTEGEIYSPDGRVIV